MWPAYRLLDARWATVGDLRTMSRSEVLDINEVLDALEEHRAQPDPKTPSARRGRRGL